VDHCAARESERRPHAKKNLGEERMAQSSKSQDQKCQRVVENQIARGRNLAGNGAHSWQAEMLSGKRNSLPQTSIGGKSQPAEKIKKSLGTGHTTKSNCDEENQHYTQTAVDFEISMGRIKHIRAPDLAAMTVLQFGAEERKTKTETKLHKTELEKSRILKGHKTRCKDIFFH
jgi:hypothetical protein